MNLNLTLSKIVEDGRILTKLYGPGFTGLENLGNSCYMASIIQVLFSLEHFQIIYLDTALEHLTNCLNNPVECYYCQISKLMYGMNSGMYSLKKTKTLPIVDENKPQEIEEYQDGIRPASFKNFFHKGHKEFNSGKQQDALEYLSYILEKFERQEKMSGNPNPKSPFEFELENRLECVHCHIVKYQRTTNFYLNLTVPNWETKREKGSKVTLEECLSKFTGSEVVELDCPNCKKKSNFEKTQKITDFPAYLIIVFERFVYEWVPIKLDVDFIIQSEKIDFKDLIRNHSNTEEKVVVEEEVKKEEIETDPEFNQEALNELIQNGIPELAAKHSLLNTGNSSSEEAMNWYFMNMENQDIQKPIKKIKKPSQIADSRVKISDENINSIKDMGFTQKRAEYSLAKCDNNLERALDYLFNHMDDEDVVMNVGPNVGSSNNSNISKFLCKNKNSSLYSLYGNYLFYF